MTTRLWLDPHVYKPSHGPQKWPWWKLLTVHVVRCSHDPAQLFWIPPISYNAWVYTRWGARCITYHFRRGIYRPREDWTWP